MKFNYVRKANMMSRTKQQEEIETIKERNIVLKLSDADCEKIFELCGKNNLSISELLENFIGDLIDGTYSNGSDERELAQQWLERCGFDWNPKPTLLQWFLEEWVSVEGFLDLIDNIEIGYKDLENYQIDPNAYDEEEIGFLKTDIEDWEEELIDYKSRYKEENPDADWDKELVNVKEWFETKKRFVEGGTQMEEKKIEKLYKLLEDKDLDNKTRAALKWAIFELESIYRNKKGN